MKVMSTLATYCAMGKDPSQLFELASVLVCFDHIASFIVNANHSVMRPAVDFGEADCSWLDAG